RSRLGAVPPRLSARRDFKSRFIDPVSWRGCQRSRVCRDGGPGSAAAAGCRHASRMNEAGFVMQL
ncbi:hypothetical protein, partial [Burkholderia glumae]|uniref:hypothetical protein n=1 Tax=Burkholderia glumae TaxID=337 RepID=UPI0019D6FF4A